MRTLFRLQPCCVIACGSLLLFSPLSAATLGDFNNDGFADLAVGSPGETVDGFDAAGAVTVIYGSASGLETASAQRLTEADVFQAADGHQFGAAVAPVDLNGDGFDDLAVGVPGASNFIDRAGAVYVLFGSAAGIVTDDFFRVQQGDFLFTDFTEENDRYGSALTSGDYNGDGVGDLIIGIAQENFEDDGLTDTNTGETMFIHGSPVGAYTVGQTSRSCWSSGLRPEDWFGVTLASGDLDGDGLDDLAIGVPGRDANVEEDGEALVAYGDVPRICQSFLQADRWRQSSPGVLDSSEERDFFGDAVAIGDFNGDGFGDLAVGVSGEASVGTKYVGAVSILPGSADGLTATGDQLIGLSTPDVLGEPADFDFFGSRLVSGDFNGDQFADLAVHVGGHDVDGAPDAGAVSVLYGSAEGLSGAGSQFWTEDSLDVPGEAAERDFFGAVLAAGDVDGDGFDELLLGTPRNSVDGLATAGTVTVLSGSASGLSAMGSQLLSQNSLGVGEAAEGNRFGASMPSSAGPRWKSQASIVDG